jgi:hypothetical protein
VAPRDTFDGVGVGRKTGSGAEEAIRRGHFFYGVDPGTATSCNRSKHLESVMKITTQYFEVLPSLEGCPGRRRDKVKTSNSTHLYAESATFGGPCTPGIQAYGGDSGPLPSP